MSQLATIIYSAISGAILGAAASEIILYFIRKRKFKMYGMTVEQAKQKLDEMLEESDDVVIVFDSKDVKIRN